jgi:hypothetical protein
MSYVDINIYQTTYQTFGAILRNKAILFETSMTGSFEDVKPGASWGDSSQIVVSFVSSAGADSGNSQGALILCALDESAAR